MRTSFVKLPFFVAVSQPTCMGITALLLLTIVLQADARAQQSSNALDSAPTESATLSANPATGDSMSTEPVQMDDTEIQIEGSDEQSTSGWREKLGTGWSNLWQSQLTRRQQLLERQDYEKLANDDGNAAWDAVKKFRDGDFEEAVEAYSGMDGTDAKYNAATALAKKGDLEEALNAYDEVLAVDPDHEDARHNREIVEQMKQQQEQQQQSGDGEQQDQENQEQGEQQDQEKEDGEQKQSDGDQQEQSDSRSGEQSEQQEQSQSKEQEQNGEELSEEEQRQKAAQEQASLEQARREAAEEMRAQAMQQEPLTEEEQATEQWLRQIPDDPAGLLRRKLQRSHATDYQSIGDSTKPW